MNNPSHILVVEDDAGITRLLRTALQTQHHHVLEAPTCALGLAHAATRPPDLVLLDLGLPDMDGLEFLTRLREWSQAPVIVISARQKEDDKVNALDAGADDYLTKPFSTAELLARVGASLRRAARAKAGAAQEPVYRHDDLTVDFAAHRVFLGDAKSGTKKEVHLTALEFSLLALLAKHAGKVLTHSFLLKEVWGPANEDENHYLRVYVASLRRKIEAEPGKPKHLLTELGVGYRMAD